MGGGSSVQLLYTESIHWFQKYFDSESAIRDFNELDIDHDGGISYKELQIWLKRKAETEGGSWKTILANSEVFNIAHRQAVKRTMTERSPTAHMFKTAQLGMAEFQLFLLHLFAVSILWVHYRNADAWEEPGSDAEVAFDQLTLEEFRLGCRSFNVAVGNEQLELTDDELAADFRRLDTDGDGHLQFSEVCDYCCSALDAPSTVSENGAFQPDKSLAHLLQTVTESNAWCKDTSSFKNRGKAAAMDAITREIQRNKTIASFVEMKMDTMPKMNTTSVSFSVVPTGTNSFSAASTNISFSAPQEHEPQELRTPPKDEQAATPLSTKSKSFFEDHMISDATDTESLDPPLPVEVLVEQTSD